MHNVNTGHHEAKERVKGKGSAEIREKGGKRPIERNQKGQKV